MLIFEWTFASTLALPSLLYWIKGVSHWEKDGFKKLGPLRWADITIRVAGLACILALVEDHQHGVVDAIWWARAVFTGLGAQLILDGLNPVRIRGRSSLQLLSDGCAGAALAAICAAPWVPYAAIPKALYELLFLAIACLSAAGLLLLAHSRVVRS